MTTWLNGAIDTTSGLSVETLCVRFGAALVLGLLVAFVFRVSHGKNHPRAQTLMTTLILLSLLIAMVSMVIGGSVALAFSLVGALSIVRFRTVVEDTRDTAFVIFAVVAGMAAGAGQLLVPVVGVPLVGVTAILLSRRPVDLSVRTATLSVKLGLGKTATDLVQPFLAKYCSRSTLRSASTTKQGAAIQLTWDVELSSPDAMVEMVTGMNQVDGILSVELTAE